MMQIYKERPPFVQFDEKEYGINQQASEAAGRPVPNVCVFAFITPAGSKDCVEKPATEWLDQIRQKAIKGEYPPEWAERFRMQYEEYLKGNELPREGTPIKTWQMINREQANRLRAVNITTVEDLAAVPEHGLSMIGLDARYLRDTAQAWIAEAKDKGIVARELADANSKIEEQQAVIDRLAQRIADLETRAESKGEGKRKAS